MQYTFTKMHRNVCQVNISVAIFNIFAIHPKEGLVRRSVKIRPLRMESTSFFLSFAQVMANVAVFVVLRMEQIEDTPSISWKNGCP